MTPKIILIHPPVVKPSEPPAGIGRLAAHLAANAIEYRVIDANLEGLMHLITAEAAQAPIGSRWDLRARRNVQTNLSALRDKQTYRNFSRYQRAVLDIDRLFYLAGQRHGASLSLSDYKDEHYTPVRHDDLIAAAKHPEQNPFYPYFSERLTQALNESPDYLGFSVNYLSQAVCAMAMIGWVKALSPSQKIVIGGSLITSWTGRAGRQVLFSGLVDEVICGPGEDALLKLMGVSDPKPSPSVDYSRFACDTYLSPGMVLPFSTASGCWWRQCAFCPETAEGHPYRPRPVPQTVSELHDLTARLQPALIHLLDSSLSPAFLSALAGMPPGAPWYGFARVTQHLASDDFCAALRQSGCVMLKLGIESGDQGVLNALSKGVDLHTVSLALKALRRAGIAVYGYFLFGTPPETDDAARRTLDFVAAHADCFCGLNLSIFNLPAASTEAKNLSLGDFYEGDLSLYRSFRHPAGWSRTNVRRFLEGEFKKHPAVAPIMKRTLPFFTSNHAPFFLF